MNCQMFSTGLSSGDFGGMGRNRDVGGNDQSCGQMPSSLIDEEDGVGSWCDQIRAISARCRFIASVLHAGKTRLRALALFRADGTEDVGGGGALITRSARAGAALRPPAGDLVLLADASLV